MTKQLNTASVRVASNKLEATDEAIEQLLDELDAANAALTLVFYGVEHDDEVIARTLDRATGPRGVGGTTAGELANDGFSDNSMTGLSLHGSGVRGAVEIIPKLDELSLVPIVHLPDKLARGIDRSRDELDPQRHLWLFLVNGLSGKEGLLTPFFMQAAPRVGLVGGSLGDGQDFSQVRLAHHGRVYRDSAAAILLEYNRPFHAFKHSHMQLTDRKLRVTKISGGGRRLEELDGELAQVAYARALDIDPAEVTASLVASHPFGYRFRGRPFPVSVQQVLPDGTFMVGNSLQHGERLNILESKELVASTRRALDAACDRVIADGGEVQAMLLFNCLSRHIEAVHSGKVDELADVLTRTPVCGLNTYGEQFETLHLNHSLTGVVFG